MSKLRLALLFGGRSAEREISVISAQNVFKALDLQKYEPLLIRIDPVGRWFLCKEANAFSENQQPVGWQEMACSVEALREQKVDLVFPVLHGTHGEDGVIQGLLKLANIPFVGSGVLSSAVCMDKDVMKRLCLASDIPVSRFMTMMRQEASTHSFTAIKEQLGLPFFVKPANLGSSVGISKVLDEAEFAEKLSLAFRYDQKVVLEAYVEGREIECSVLGNEHPIVSIPGEIIPHPSHGFYSYEAKYLDPEGASLRIPAVLTQKEIEEVQRVALRAYKALCCEGMARMDCFLKPDGQVIFNEANTLPGFTRISMYPKLWEASGLSCTQLIDRLVELALERFRNEQNLKYTYQ